ncbi:hypothetical protein AMTRI_Chr07g75500 [Amborella trichopoda]|nr:zinc finger BED domain-containing protein RICESLEEPER 2 [Amborella trichopoda]XP_020531108.1 zinc finger BED domain-containing protein RICESLEEPER 2 [Amborella trichopoda]|eukprot:XP_011628141.1 zinc finger BED domain-containing protein RICESLEEPER 2 [Amborella trichopoda]
MSHPLPSKRKTISSVWDEFEKVRSEDGSVKAACKHCHRNLVGSSAHGTSHLKRHLGRCAKRVHIGSGQQLVVTCIKKGEASSVNFKFDQGRSRYDLAKMILLHEYPSSMVEHTTFRTFVRNLQPLFSMVSPSTIESDIIEIYKKEKKKLYEELEKIPSRISLSANIWSSCQNLEYLCLIAHYIDDAWVLQKQILSFVNLPSRTGGAIAEVLLDLLSQWNVDKKLFSITLNSASYNDVAASSLRSRLSRNSSLPLEGKIFHLCCCSHVVNLMVQDGLEVIQEVLQKIRESIKYVKTSHVRQERFNEIINQLGIQSKQNIFLDVPTRWNSTYHMLDVTLELREAFSCFAQCDSMCNMVPSEDEWERVKEICDCLKLFYDITNTFLGSKYPTANLYFPEVYQMHLRLVEWSMSLNKHISSMAIKMKEKFDKYWKISNLVLAIAVVIDPRFKLKFVEYSYSQIYGNDAEHHIRMVRQGVYDLCNEYESKEPLASNSESSLAVSASTSSGGVDTHGKLWAMEFEKFVRESSSNQARKSELDRYLEEPIFPRNLDFNIRNWWQLNAPRFPTLSKMARDILGIPVSTVTSDSTFDIGGQVLDQYRSSLLPETIQALMCAQDWLWNELKGGKSSSIVAW